jgi:phage gp46-like protein
MTNNFQGDLMLIETPDGGDCVFADGLISADPAFGTAVYISLFGGNKDDAGAVKNKNTWWGNTLQGVSENEKIVSRFQNFIHVMPMTVKNIKDARDMASLDLKWIIDEGIADEIIVDTRSEGINRLRLFLKATKAGKNIFESEYGVLWGAGLNGI